MTNGNIISGFRCSGIYPLNRGSFQEYEYVQAAIDSDIRQHRARQEAIQFGVITGPFASNRHSLRDIIPLLKVTPRLSEIGRRKNGRSAIVTDDVSLSP